MICRGSTVILGFVYSFHHFFLVSTDIITRTSSQIFILCRWKNTDFTLQMSGALWKVFIQTHDSQQSHTVHIALTD